MTNSTTNIPICEVANPGGSPCTKPKGHDGGHDLAAYRSLTSIPILDDDAVGEIAEMFPHTEYQPTLSPDEVDPCEFCKGTIDDHKANCVVPHVHALCQTVRALRAKHEWLRSKIAWHRDGVGPDVPVLQERYDKLIAQRNDLRSQLEQVTKERDVLRAENERAIDVLVTAHNDTVAGLQSQLEQLTKERDNYRRRLKEWEL